MDQTWENGEIFKDVWNAFSTIPGYVVQATLLHAYGFGVPQNRPRVMIMGIRTEIASSANMNPSPFYPNDKKRSYASQLRNNGGFFPSWDDEEKTAPDLIDVLSDLDFDGWSQTNPFYAKPPSQIFKN